MRSEKWEWLVRRGGGNHRFHGWARMGEVGSENGLFGEGVGTPDFTDGHGWGTWSEGAGGSEKWEVRSEKLEWLVRRTTCREGVGCLLGGASTEPRDPGLVRRGTCTEGACSEGRPRALRAPREL